MAYGLLLRNASDNSFVNDLVYFNTIQRNGISTSNVLYFDAVNFITQEINVGIGEFGNLISSDGAVTNFNLFDFGFGGSGHNNDKPTIVEICEIKGYEIGAGNTIFASTLVKGDKILQNYSQPNYLWEVSNVDPFVMISSNFSKALDTRYVKNENFAFVNYTSDNTSLHFLAVPGSPFSWQELPSGEFYHPIDYYVSIISSGFDGTNISINYFRGLAPELNQTILINNKAYNDALSGVYVIQHVTNSVYLSKSNILFNYPSQVFISDANLDVNTEQNICHYVPFDYGTPGESFSKNLCLTPFSNGITSTAQYMPLLKDSISQSKMILFLNTQYALKKKSDNFIVGIAVSNWFNDSLIFGIDLNYQIKEGF